MNRYLRAILILILLVGICGFPLQLAARMSSKTDTAVKAVSPADLYSSTDGAWPRLTWSPGDGMTAPFGYRVQVSKSTSFASKVVDECVRGTSYLPKDAWWSQIQMGTFYWRVNYVPNAWSTQTACKAKTIVPTLWSTTLQFTNPVAYKAPTLTAPASGSSSTDGLWSAMTWTSAEGDFGGFGFRIQVHKKSSFTGVGLIVDECTSGATYRPTNDDWMRQFNGTFYWRVTYVTRDWQHSQTICKASYVEKTLWSDTRSFQNTQPANPVVVVTPADEYLSTDGLWPTLTWIPGANMPATYGYRIQVSKNADFSTPDVDECLKGTSYTPADKWWAQERMGTYHWRVNYVVSAWSNQAQCKSQSVKTVSWSSAQRFINPVAPKRVILSSPADGITSTDGLWPTLSWSPAEGDFGGLGYRIQVSKTSNFATLLVNECTTSVTYHPSDDNWARLQTGTFYWRVNYVTRAWRGNQSTCKGAFLPAGLWSSTRNFRNP